MSVVRSWMARHSNAWRGPGRDSRDGLDHEAIARCREVIAAHSKSFALASRVFPPDIRDRAAVIYAFCRHADDAIDLAPDDERPRALVELRRTLDAIYRGDEQADISLAAFQALVRICQIPRYYPDELLAGMEMDVLGTRYATMDELLRYCFRVAGTVGLMMCHAMGVRDDAYLENAVHLGIGMQLTNICRDVLEDWDMGRLYLPDELLARHSLGDLRSRLGQPFPADARAGVAQVVRQLLDRADRYYRSGDRGLAGLPWRCALAVRAARMIYAAIGTRIAARDHDITRGRAVVPRDEKLRLLARATAAGVAEIPQRVAARMSGAPRPRVPHSMTRFPEHVSTPPASI